MNNIKREMKKINNEIDNRLAENKENYYFQLNLFKEEFLVEESYVKGGIGNKLKNLYDLKSDTETIFTTIENKFIGGLAKSNISLNYDKFINCSFKDIKFESCTFYGTMFSSCDFKNVEFSNCLFFGSSGILFISNCNFQNCSFNNCNMENSLIRDSILANTKFVLSNLRNSIFAKVCLNQISIIDCDFRSLKIIDHNIKGFEFRDSFVTKFDEDTFISPIDLNQTKKEHLKDEFYERYFKFYKIISSKFAENGLLDISGSYYYLSKSIERKLLKGITKIKSYIFWMLCGYGEKPTYALVTSLEIILIFTIIYMFAGLNINGDIINYRLFIIKDLADKNLILDFMKSLYFSIVTFTTVGYGDITPIGYSVILSGIEMFLGVTMVGVWTATLARKISR